MGITKLGVWRLVRVTVGLALFELFETFGTCRVGVVQNIGDVEVWVDIRLLEVGGDCTFCAVWVELLCRHSTCS